MKAAYTKNVALLSPNLVADIIKGGGSENPIQFFQAGLIRAWFARCNPNNLANKHKRIA